MIKKKLRENPALRNKIKEMLGISDSTLKRRLRDNNWGVKELFIVAKIINVDVLTLIDEI